MEKLKLRKARKRQAKKAYTKIVVYY